MADNEMRSEACKRLLGICSFIGLQVSIGLIAGGALLVALGDDDNIAGVLMLVFGILLVILCISGIIVMCRRHRARNRAAVERGQQTIVTGYNPQQQGTIYQQPQGYTGNDQPRGYTGLQQQRGYTGQQQPQGYTGHQQTQGYTGHQQTQGYTGHQQPQGYTGHQQTQDVRSTDLPPSYDDVRLHQGGPHKTPV